MERPKDCKEMLSFLGLVTYLGPFIPNLSDMTSPLRELIKKNQKFEWNESHQMAYDRIKNSISEHVILSYFDPSQEVTLQVDASTKGLGAANPTEWETNCFCQQSFNGCGS